MRIKFWGVRGSLPIPGQTTLKYGGNTSCIEIDTGKKDETIIIDAGSGIKALGQELMDRGFCDGNKTGYLFLSHYHLDHILGFPFFAPFFTKGENKNRFVIYGPKPKIDSLKEIINHLISAPFFPLSLNRLNVVLDFKEIEAGDIVNLSDINPALSAPKMHSMVRKGGVKVSTGRLNHPGGCLAYRFDSGNVSAVYATDTEPIDGINLDSKIIDLTKSVDVLIYDATYTPEEYVNKKGWGHSTWTHGIKLANEACVKKLVLFHHDLNHSDRMLSQIGKEAKREFKNAEMAKEGMEINI